MRILGTILTFLIYLSGCSNESVNNSLKESTFRIPSLIDSINRDSIPSGFPIYDPIFYDSIVSQVENGKLRPSQSYNYLLKIGKYNEVKLATEQRLEWGLNMIDSSEILKLEKYRLVDAQKYIVEQSQNHEIIIISEAHTKPEHRVFTRCLLEGLYANGYRHLGLENIQPLLYDKGGKMLDSIMNERGYPTITVLSGIYTSEPEYANLIREAIDIGFTIFSYERNSSSDSERDRQQAERIISYIESIPDGDKVICHAGWYHAIEEPIKKRSNKNDYWLAYEFKRLTGIDPLTVYQDALNYKISNDQGSSPYYKHIESKFDESTKPLVLVNENGDSWQGPGDSLPFDIITIQPRMNYDFNSNILPWDSWNCSSCKMNELQFDVFKVNTNLNKNESYLVELRRYYESELATPVYSKEVSIDNSILNLILCIGEYNLTFIDRRGNKYRTVISI